MRIGRFSTRLIETHVRYSTVLSEGRHGVTKNGGGEEIGVERGKVGGKEAEWRRRKNEVSNGNGR